MDDSMIRRMTTRAHRRRHDLRRRLGNEPDLINRCRKGLSIFWRGAALLCLVILPMAASAQGAAADEPQLEKCRKDAVPSWTPQEQWVWGKLCQREDADLSSMESVFGIAPSVDESDGWPESRTLSAEFIETIMTEPQYADNIKDRPIYITGARYPSAIDLRNSKISGSLQLAESRFEDSLFLSNASISGDLELRDSYFGNALDFENATVGAAINLARSHFREGFMVNMRGVEANGSIALDESKFGGVVDLTEAVLNNSLGAEKATFLGDVYLSSAQVGGAVDLTGARIQGDFHMSRARVDGALILGGSPPTSWGEGRALYLDGATVQGLDDDRHAWPQRIFMSDFMFDGLRTTGDSRDGFIDRDSGWYEDWLRRDPGFCRMVYTQLETSLRAVGRSSEADAIGMDRVEQEYRKASNAVFPLALVHYATVGYGYQPERIIPWIVNLIVLGAIVALFLPLQAMNKAGASSLVIFSTHRLIPLISFGHVYANVDVSSQEVDRWVRRYFYLHSILGYVLAAILVTAVAGITSVPALT
jgi:hypothetical protein